MAAKYTHDDFKKRDPITGCEYYLYPNVTLGENVQIYQYAIVGFPPRGKEIGELHLDIGENSVIRPFTTIYAGNKIGKRFQSGHSMMMREGNVIGDNVIIGSCAVLECGNVFGDNITFHTLSCAGNAIIESHAFIGPHVQFCDDPHPKCPSYKECKRGATVKQWARIGGVVTLLPGVTVGVNALVGGGSTVARDIPDHAVAAGNPAVVLGRIQDQACYPGIYQRPYEWLNGANLQAIP